MNPKNMIILLHYIMIETLTEGVTVTNKSDTIVQEPLDTHRLIVHCFFTGFKLNSSTLAALVFKYSNVHSQISTENFFICLAKLMKLFSKYFITHIYLCCLLLEEKY